MLAVLENPEIRRRALPISISAYHSMTASGLVKASAELIRGVIVEKMPKSPLHEILTSGIHERLLLLLASGPWWVRKEGPLSLADSEPEPDVSIVPGKAADYFGGHPATALLVVEVAVTSAGLDREKLGLYAEAGVGECWLVLAHERVVEIHTGAKDGRWTTTRRVTADETIEAAAVPGVRLRLADLLPV